MQKTQLLQINQHEEVQTPISYFALSGLLPAGQTLAFYRETRTVSLLCEGPLLLAEQQCSVNEMHVLLPILEAFPHYCSYEELLAHISSNLVTETSIARCRLRLQEAQSRGTWQQELRPIRRALSPLRRKLHRFGLEISNIRERGCSLTSLIAT